LQVPKFRLIDAGHSLGGALATLAALEIRQACPDHSKLDISCYTFGAPRTGNHAFAHEYNEGVPDTWGIINDQVLALRLPVTTCGARAVMLTARLCFLCRAISARTPEHAQCVVDNMN